MTLTSIIPSLFLASGCVAYVFWRQTKVDAPHRRSQLDYLRERKDVVYDNLRDLNFEFRSGKYPLADYTVQRESLEAEAARILEQIKVLEQGLSESELLVR